MLPRFSIFQQEYNVGGLKTPVIEHMLEARLMTILIKLITRDNLWSKFERMAGRMENLCEGLEKIRRKGEHKFRQVAMASAKIKIAQIKGEEYLVKKATDFLRGKFLKPTLTLLNQGENVMMSNSWKWH
ncbi:4905_t:CDS:2, partial [Ambispora leptoticha]